MYVKAAHHMIEAFLKAAASDPVYAECSGEIMQFLLHLGQEERDHLINGYLHERLQHNIERLEEERAELHERLEELWRQNQELRENEVAN